jgi:hypothetical protein
MFTGNYVDQEVLLYHLQSLIDPLARGEVKGPAEAPFSAENLRDMITGRADTLRQLQDDPAHIADGIWEWAHFILLWSRWWYQEAQPRLAADPAVQASPALQAVYRVENLETAANAACVDLLTTIALAPHAQNATHLPPELTPEPWLTGRLTLSVDIQQQISPFVLPNGSHNAYVAHTVRLHWRI